MDDTWDSILDRIYAKPKKNWTFNDYMTANFMPIAMNYKKSNFGMDIFPNLLKGTTGAVKSIGMLLPIAAVGAIALVGLVIIKEM